MRIAYRAHVFNNSYLTIQTKLMLYSTLVTSVCLYGCGMWRLNVSEINQLESINFNYLRYIIPNMNRTSSYEDVIMEAANHGCPIVPIQCMIAMRCLRFLGHVERLEPDKLQKIIIHCRVADGKQCRGAPGISYRHAVIRALDMNGIGKISGLYLQRIRLNGKN